MRFARTLQLVDVHCEGEVGKVITGGVIDVPGTTMADKLAHINDVDDSLRRFVTREPRACLPMSVNLLLAPTRPEADAGLIVLQSDKAHAMSGSNAICFVTALLELGYVASVEGRNTVTLDTAAGLVRAEATMVDGRCRQVALDMPDAFVHALDATVDVPGLGTITLDIAYGGVFYGLVNAADLGLVIAPDQARALASAGHRILAALNAQHAVAHPEHPAIHGVAYVMFRQPAGPDHYRTCTVLPPGRVDRSPCGTGSSAHMATLAARDAIDTGGHFVSESTIGGFFQLTCRERTQVAGRTIVRPTVTGRAWLYGFQQLGLDPTDPLAEGFTVSDTWGVA